jgi:Uncharacterised nucleotidyltransferase
MPESLVLTGDARSRPEVDLLLLCARTQMTPEISERIRAAVRKGIDWIALIRLAMRHDVMPLLYRNLQKVCLNSVPDNILGPLRTRYEVQAAQARCRAEELVRILALVEDQGIRAVPYKGPVLAQRLYGDLSLREFGDLDIMIPESDLSKVQDLLQRIGYEFEYLKDISNCESRCNHRPSGTRLELHWRFTAQLAGIKQDPDRFLQRFETVSIAGAQVRSLPLETYFLTLSMHGAKHKWRQLKLICDIAEILRRSDVDWKYVLSEADDLGLKRMLAVAVLLAEDQLEVPVPAELVHGLKFDRTARALAAQVRRDLYEEPDEHWLEQAEFLFQVKIRERWRDRAGMLYRNLPSKFVPDERDRRFFPMPDSFSSMYFLVRPVRWAWERMNDR